MRRLGILLLLVGVFALSGCIPGLEGLFGDGSGGGPIGPIAPAGPTYILVEYQVSTIAVRADTGDEQKVAVASIGSVGDISYDPNLHRVTCDATIGDLSVQMWIFLSPDENIIDYIKVRRNNAIGFGAWRRYDFIESYSVASATIELDRMEGNNKVFRIDQTTFYDFCDAIMTVEWKEWRPDPPYNESHDFPFWRLKDPYSPIYHDCDDPGNFVEITLEYD